MTSAYQRVKNQYDDIQERYYALLDSCDRYAALLDALVVEEQSNTAPNPELIRRYTHQRREIDELVDQLETGPMEPLLRIGDRILMIRETEEGRFF